MYPRIARCGGFGTRREVILFTRACPSSVAELGLAESVHAEQALTAIRRSDRKVLELVWTGTAATTSALRVCGIGVAVDSCMRMGSQDKSEQRSKNKA